MKWKGFRKESISYINPRTIKQWVEFWLEYPSAWYRFNKLMKEDEWEPKVQLSGSTAHNIDVLVEKLNETKREDRDI